MLPSVLFFDFVVYYLPYKVARSVCKLNADLETEIRRSKINLFMEKAFGKGDYNVDYLLKNKFFLSISMEPTNLYRIKKHLVLKYINDVYLFKFFNITKSQLFDLIRIDMSTQYVNAMHLTDDNIEQELSMYLNITDVINQLNFIAYGNNRTAIAYGNNRTAI